MSEKADRVLLNGKIVAVDSDFSIHEAISIRGGKILSMDSTEELKGLISPEPMVDSYAHNHRHDADRRHHEQVHQDHRAGEGRPPQEEGGEGVRDVVARDEGS